LSRAVIRLPQERVRVDVGVEVLPCRERVVHQSPRGWLPPGTDHVHQVVFIVLSPAGLLLPVREFFPVAGG
jgi:hypothetical protein